jgi:hypothetical protein
MYYIQIIVIPLIQCTNTIQYLCVIDWLELIGSVEKKTPFLLHLLGVGGHAFFYYVPQISREYSGPGKYCSMYLRRLRRSM